MCVYYVWSISDSIHITYVRIYVLIYICNSMLKLVYIYIYVCIHYIYLCVYVRIYISMCA